MKRLMMIVIVAATLAPASCKSKPRVCDPEGLEKLEAALVDVPRARRAEMTAMGLSDACSTGETKLPGGVKQALEGLYQGPPEYRSMQVMKGIAEEMVLFGKVCKGGPGALAKVGEVAPGEKLDVMWKGCGLGDDVGFASRAELEQQPLELTLTALMVHRWLTDGGVDKDRAKKIGRGLAGL